MKSSLKSYYTKNQNTQIEHHLSHQRIWELSLKLQRTMRENRLFMNDPLTPIFLSLMQSFGASYIDTHYGLPKKDKKLHNDRGGTDKLSTGCFSIFRLR